MTRPWAKGTDIFNRLRRATPAGASAGASDKVGVAPLICCFSDQANFPRYPVSRKTIETITARTSVTPCTTG